MLHYPTIKCPRGLENRRSYGQIVTDEDIPMKGSFFVAVKMMGPWHQHQRIYIQNVSTVSYGMT